LILEKVAVASVNTKVADVTAPYEGKKVNKLIIMILGL